MANNLIKQNIIKNNTIVNDEWQLISDVNIIDIPPGKIILPLIAWNRFHDSLKDRNELPGLFLNSDEDPGQFAGKITSLSLIAVGFPVFTDGRGFTIGNLLRDRYAYKGELRASGGFIRDQLYYLKRCGFDAFQFNNNIDLTDALKSFNDFSNDYQCSSSQHMPLFRRRSNSP